jgi:hypothetical protein
MTELLPVGRGRIPGLAEPAQAGALRASSANTWCLRASGGEDGRGVEAGAAVQAETAITGNVL